MTPAEHAALRQHYNFRCGYCGVSETDVGAALTVDHFQPTSRAGQDTLTNWVYCCFACNNAKGDYWQPDSPHDLPLSPQDAGQLERILPQGILWVGLPAGSARSLHETVWYVSCPSSR